MPDMYQILRISGDVSHVTRGHRSDRYPPSLHHHNCKRENIILSAIHNMSVLAQCPPAVIYTSLSNPSLPKDTFVPQPVVSLLPESICLKRKSQSCDDQQPPTPEKREAEPTARGPKAAKLLHAPAPNLEDLPNELLRLILLNLGSAIDLCVARQVFVDEREVFEWKWRQLYIEEHGLSAHSERAAVLAGSWQELFKRKTLKLRETRRAAAPGQVAWEEPCDYEVQAAIENLHTAATDSRGGGLCIVFLLDGSGSVTEDDFKTMRAFVGTAINNIAAKHPDVTAAILQFSNDVRVEVAPQSLDSGAFSEQLSDMSRMNGGTNIATAIQRAGQLLKNPYGDAEDGTTGDDTGPAGDTIDSEDCAGEVAKLETLPHPPEITSRVIVLLTDGRVDGYQALEAVAITGQLADEQAGVRLHAFAVGRDVDKKELLRIVQACDDTCDPEDFYLGLRTLDEKPW